MIFAKLDVCFWRHKKFVRAGAAACGYYAAALAYLREDESSDGLLEADVAGQVLGVGDREAKKLLKKLVDVGLFEPHVRGHVLLRYAEKNETRDQIDTRRAATRERVRGFRHGRNAVTNTNVTATPLDSVTRTESESESEPKPESERSENTAPLALVPPEPAKSGKVRKLPAGDYAGLIAYYATEFERVRRVKPSIAAKDGAAAKALLRGRALAEACEIVRRAFADPFVAEKRPDLTYIASAVNSYIGTAPANGTRRGPWLQPPAPPGQGWKMTGESEDIPP